MAAAVGSDDEYGHDGHDDFLDDLDGIEEAVEISYALSAVRAKASRETLADRLAAEHSVKGSIRIPVTIIEELMTHVGGDDAAPVGDAPEVAVSTDIADQEGEDPEVAKVEGAETAEQPEQPVSGAMSGTVARFMPDKGYGFITPDDGGEDIFIHIKQCNGAESLSAGDIVTYDNEWNDKKGKAQGNNCTVSAPNAYEAPQSEWTADPAEEWPAPEPAIAEEWPVPEPAIASCAAAFDPWSESWPDWQEPQFMSSIARQASGSEEEEEDDGSEYEDESDFSGRDDEADEED